MPAPSSLSPAPKIIPVLELALARDLIASALREIDQTGRFPGECEMLRGILNDLEAVRGGRE